MAKLNPLKIINPILGIIFLIMAVSGMLMACFPAVIPYMTVATIHKYGGFAMIILTIGHIFHNWGWIKANMMKKKPAKPS